MSNSFEKPKTEKPLLRAIDTAQPTIDTRELFNDMFKPGEDVLIIDEEDNFHFGRIVLAVDIGLILKPTPRKKEKVHLWEDIRFISHDGFPVKKLMTSNSDKYVQQLFSPDKEEFIRRVLTNDFKVTCSDCGALIDNEKLKRHKAQCGISHTPSRRTYYGGCPWRVEDVKSQLINPGNGSDYFQYENDKFIETVLLNSVDGALGMLWHLGSIFHFE